MKGACGSCGSICETVYGVLSEDSPVHVSFVCDSCRKCFLCDSGEVLPDSVKDSERLDGWAGIDFYGDVCLACWEVEKARR